MEFKREVSEITGEVSTKTIATYHNCKIVIYDSNTVLFSGSIHKMYNSLTNIKAPNHNEVKDYKGFNGNQFYFHEIDFVRQHLTSLFAVPPENMIIQNIEYGQNLTTSFDPQDFIRWLLLFEMKTFEFKYSEYFAQSVHNQYILKIYNKGNQYNMAMHNLRFEMKVIKMEHQKKDVGIETLADISMMTIQKTFQYLHKQLEKILYYDITIDKTRISPGQKVKLKDYNNSRYWQGLTSKERSRNKKRLNNLIKLMSQNLRLELHELLQQNWVQFDRLSENNKWVQFDSSSIVSNNTLLPQRKCPITGLNISMQKPTSIMLSNTGLKHLEKTNLQTFIRLKNKLLTGRKNKYEKDIYSMMSKQIRNRRNCIIKKYNPNQIKLFITI